MLKLLLVNEDSINDVLEDSLKVQDLLQATSLSHMLTKNQLRNLNVDEPLLPSPANDHVTHPLLINKEQLQVIATVDDPFFPKIIPAFASKVDGQPLNIETNGMLYVFMPVSTTSGTPTHAYSSLTVNGLVHFGSNLLQTPIIVPVKKGDSVTLTKTIVAPDEEERKILYDHHYVETIDAANVYLLPQ